jgi:hypothetical protein
MNLRAIVFATMGFSVAVYGQNPITADSPYQTRYASNLTVADSVINLSNTGAHGASLGAGFSAAVSGSICVNVYAFAADEEMVSCCSCPVTPNGLVALSVQKDILNNSLTGRGTSSLAIALVATAPVASSCTNSAAVQGTLVPGMTAWLHAEAAPVAGTCTGGTETPFTPSTLSAAEFSRLTNLCSFVQAQGSGFGICNSCEQTGLGAAASNQ